MTSYKNLYLETKNLYGRFKEDLVTGGAGASKPITSDIGKETDDAFEYFGQITEEIQKKLDAAKEKEKKKEEEIQSVAEKLRLFNKVMGYVKIMHSYDKKLQIVKLFMKRGLTPDQIKTEFAVQKILTSEDIAKLSN